MLRSFCMSVKQQLDKKCLLSNPVVAYQCVTESQLPPNDVSYCAMPLFMERLCGNVLYVYEHVWHMWVRPGGGGCSRNGAVISPGSASNGWVPVQQGQLGLTSHAGSWFENRAFFFFWSTNVFSFSVRQLWKGHAEEELRAPEGLTPFSTHTQGLIGVQLFVHAAYAYRNERFIAEPLGTQQKQTTKL